MNPRTEAELSSLAAGGRAFVLVEISEAKGSVPREPGSFMLVSAESVAGTIGGGQLEFRGIAHARALLRGESDRTELDMPLGPDIGQCCGGRVSLRFRTKSSDLVAEIQQRLTDIAAKRPHIHIYGAGHVGRALARALSLTPVSVTVVETRDAELQKLDAPGVQTRLTALPEAIIADAPAGSAFLAMTHEHAQDFLIVTAALERRDAAYVGMIASKTKRATFEHQFKREGHDEALLAHLISPIGKTGLEDKRPDVIAALVVAEVLQAVL